ncbi:MAG: MotA/TolQ/ExbB proton channel family protein [Pseudomonadota bacterium]
MNIATLIGVFSGLGILSWAIYSATGNFALFLQPEGLAIVWGGVTAATFISYPLSDVLRSLGTFLKVLRRESLPVVHYINAIHYLAERALVGGIIHLEKDLKGEENFFLQDAVRMVMDRYPLDRVRQILENTIEKAREAELNEAAMFRTMARFSPAFGMVGTLIGLIDLFQNLGDNMSGIGPAMGLAMLTTFYGVLLANLLFLPIAIKMERRVDEHTLLMEVIMEGVLLVAVKTPPGMVRDQLKAFIPARQWKDVRVGQPSKS